MVRKCANCGRSPSDSRTTEANREIELIRARLRQINGGSSSGIHLISTDPDPILPDPRVTQPKRISENRLTIEERNSLSERMSKAGLSRKELAGRAGVFLGTVEQMVISGTGSPENRDLVFTALEKAENEKKNLIESCIEGVLEEGHDSINVPFEESFEIHEETVLTEASSEIDPSFVRIPENETFAVSVGSSPKQDPQEEILGFPTDGRQNEKSGHEIRRRRKALGLTVKELAERLGITRSYLSVIESTAVMDTPIILKVKSDLVRIEEGINPDRIVMANKKETPMPPKTPEDLSTIRKERLGTLTRHFGGPFRISRKYPKLSSGTLSNVLRGKYGMGPTQARKIEEVVGLPFGWMDGETPADLPEISGEQTSSKKNAGPNSETTRNMSVVRVSGDLPVAQESRSGDMTDSPRISQQSLSDILSSFSSNPRVLRIDVVSIILNHP